MVRVVCCVRCRCWKWIFLPSRQRKKIFFLPFLSFAFIEIDLLCKVLVIQLYSLMIFFLLLVCVYLLMPLLRSFWYIFLFLFLLVLLLSWLERSIFFLFWLWWRFIDYLWWIKKHYLFHWWRKMEGMNFFLKNFLNNFIPGIIWRHKFWTFILNSIKIFINWIWLYIETCVIFKHSMGFVNLRESSYHFGTLLMFASF